MAIYTQLTDDDINKIALTYGLAQVESVSPFLQGGENSNFRLDTNDNSYVLTICESKSTEQTKTLINTLVYLEDAGYWTTRIVPTAAGQHQSEFNGKPLLLKSFLHGEVLDLMPESSMEALGKSLGSLHKIPVPDFLPRQIGFGIQTFQPLRNEYGKEHPFLTWLEEIENFLNNVLAGDYPFALIHADVFADNVVHVGNRGPVIMDFEEAAIYYQMFDVGMTIVGTCLRTMGKKCHLDREAQDKLLAGYCQVIQPSADELKALKAFIVYAAAAMATWRFRQFNMLHPELGKQDHYLMLQSIAVEELAKV